LFSAPDGSTLDIQRVEVLRGPQGTIFGEGSMGGTIRIISNKPDLSEFGGDVSLGTSQIDDGDSSWSAGAVLNVPIAEEVFGLRLASRFDDMGGYIDNPLLGKDDINTAKKGQLRLKTLWMPSKQLSVEFTYFMDRTDFDGRSIAMEVDSLEFGSFGEESGYSDFDLYDLTIEYDLGFANLVSATSFTKGDQIQPIVLDLGSFIGSTTINTLETETKSSELRLVSTGGSAFFWTIGGIYTEKEFDGLLDVQFRLLQPTAVDPFTALFGLAPGFSALNLEVFGLTSQPSESWAIFGEIGYEFSEKLTASLGLRYFDAEFGGENNIRTTTGITFLDPTFTPYTDNGLWALAGLTNPFVTTVTDSNSSRGDDSAISPRLNVSYALNENANAYFSVAKGFRSGGVNPVTSTVNFVTGEIVNFEPSYDSETLWTYELGVKAYLDDSRWLVEGAVYYTDWKDIQTTFVGSQVTISTTVNGEEAEIYGFDGNLTFVATDELTVGVSLNYTHGEYKQTEVFSEGKSLDFADGDPLPSVPEWSGSAYASWRPQLTESLAGLVHLVYSYQDETFKASRTNLAYPLQQMDELSFFNLRVGVDAENWGAHLYATNLLNESGLSAPSSPSTAGIVGYPVIKPRTVGIDFKFNF